MKASAWTLILSLAAAAAAVAVSAISGFFWFLNSLSLSASGPFSFCNDFDLVWSGTQLRGLALVFGPTQHIPA